MDQVEIIESPVSLAAPYRASSLADLIFRPLPSENDADPIIMGTIGAQGLDVSLRAFRWTLLNLIHQFDKAGLYAGDTVCLVRLPHTSETAVSTAYAALSAAGLRVLFLMYLESDVFGQWLSMTETKAVLWSAQTVREMTRHEADCALLERLSAVAADHGVPVICLDEELQIPMLLQMQPESSPALDDALVTRLLSSTNLDTECLILTTSGTSGHSKLVCYQQGAFIRSCTSWEQAGLFDASCQGGRGLCLLLAHSMGLRAFWNAVWTRQPICLIPPEWFLEAHRTSELPLGEQYFGWFRSFCTASPARDYYFLHLALLGRTLNADAVPAYLTETGYSVLHSQLSQVSLHQKDVMQFLEDAAPASFNKMHLSNICDWMDQEAFEKVMTLIAAKCAPGGRIVWRFLHIDRALSSALAARISEERELGRHLRQCDRYPFYTIVPARMAA